MKRNFILAGLFFVISVSFLAAKDSVTLLSKTVSLSWSDNITIDASDFSSARAGDAIEIKYKHIKADYHKFKIYAVSGNWMPLGFGGVSGAKFMNGDFETVEGKGTIEITLTADDVSGLKRGGLIMHGYGLKVTKITLGSQSSVSVSSVPAPNVDPAPVVLGGSVPKERPPVSLSSDPFARHGALHVEGASLYDSYNIQFQLYGMSTHGLSWFGEYVNQETFRSLRDDWNTNCVRLALYPAEYNGYCNGGNKEQLKKLVCDGIDYATALGMYVIVDWHILSMNPMQYKEQAKVFLAEISNKYSSYGNVLYEVCNEPTGSDWNSVLKPYAEELIAIIRHNAPDAIVIVGTNTWSQDVDKAASNPITKYNNVMYSLHFYANTHTQWLRDRLETALRAGLPVFVTEFGTCDASGNGGFNPAETQRWFDLLAKYHVSHCNWSLCNKAESASVIASSCRKLSGWTENELTESGRLVRQHFLSLKQ